MTKENFASILCVNKGERPWIIWEAEQREAPLGLLGVLDLGKSEKLTQTTDPFLPQNFKEFIASLKPILRTLYSRRNMERG